MEYRKINIETDWEFYLGSQRYMTRIFLEKIGSPINGMHEPVILATINYAFTKSPYLVIDGVNRIDLPYFEDTKKLKDFATEKIREFYGFLIASPIIYTSN